MLHTPYPSHQSFKTHKRAYHSQRIVTTWLYTVLSQSIKSQFYLWQASWSSIVHPGDHSAGPSSQGPPRTWRHHLRHSAERIVQADMKRLLRADRSASQVSPNSGTLGPTSPSPGDCSPALST